jgi:hypothetical protein
MLDGAVDRLDDLAEALLEHETLDEDDAYTAAGVAHAAAAPAEALAVAALSTTNDTDST